MTEISPTFANTPLPWLPEKPFWQDNAAPLAELRDQLIYDYPHTTETLEQFDPASGVLPPDDARKDMWAIFMGRQHGGQQQEGDRKVLIPYGEQPYTDMVQQLHWGPHQLADRSPINQDVAYDRLMCMAGAAIGHDILAKEMAPGGRLLDNLGGAVWLSGQRQRGSFAVRGENCSPKELIDIVGGLTGTDMDHLVERFPRLRDQLKRSGEGWGRPFANESDIVELNVLAHFGRYINHAAGVEITKVQGDNEPILYRGQHGEALVMPGREYAMLSYELRDGRKIRIVNGPAVSRGNGDPRATSASIAADAPNYVPFTEGDKSVILACAPHIRAAGDTAISLLDATRLGQMPAAERYDIAATHWPLELTQYVTAGLGEVMATEKADARARAVVAGRDPNAPELTSI